MVTKKTERANLENKKVVFFEIGMVLTLASALVAIEWCSAGPQNTGSFSDNPKNTDGIMQAPVTRQPQKKIQPPPQPKIKIAENNDVIDDDPDFFSVEGTAYTFIDFFPIEPEEEPPVDSVIWFPDKKPEYENGPPEKFQRFIQKIAEYPATAAEMGLEGKVFVKFVVDKKGYVTDIEIQRGVHPLLDNAVIAAICKSKRWKPGMQNGLPVNVAMSMPVIFRLQ